MSLAPTCIRSYIAAVRGCLRLYNRPGLIDGTETVSVRKEGYQPHSQKLPMNGDTRFDVQLVRR